MLIPVLVTFCILNQNIKLRFWWNEAMVNQMIYRLVKKGLHVKRVEKKTEFFDTDDDKQTEWVQKVVSKL